MTDEMTDESTTEQNKNLVERFIVDGALRVARGDQDAVHEYLDSHFVNHTPLIHEQEAKGIHGMSENLEQAGNAIPDLTSTADLIMGEGDLVTVHWTATGTHSGEMQHRHVGQLPSSDNEVEISGVTIYRVTNGKIAEMWNYDNHLDYLVSIGVLAPSV